jgi:hypothetical protein
VGARRLATAAATRLARAAEKSVEKRDRDGNKGDQKQGERGEDGAATLDNDDGQARAAVTHAQLSPEMRRRCIVQVEFARAASSGCDASPSASVPNISRAALPLERVERHATACAQPPRRARCTLLTRDAV